MGKRTDVVPPSTQQIPVRSWWSLHWMGWPLLGPTKDRIGPLHFPSQCSLTELLGRRAEVHLTFNRKNEASVTLVCCTETVKMLFLQQPCQW